MVKEQWIKDLKGNEEINLNSEKLQENYFPVKTSIIVGLIALIL